MNRRALRENTFQMLFRVEFHDEKEYEEQMNLFFENMEEISDEDKTFITDRFKNISEKIPEIDKKLDEASTGWKTARMNKVDLTLLRLAVYEMLFDDDVPKAVAMNECVELAKKFGTDSSPSFVNGVLSNIS
ncbi:MAG: transcription antitermination factor NusB [Lachnospiraceae bacterium]|nr:transcription antitermination factor NusB [Lachnospiraceae bacterium]